MAAGPRPPISMPAGLDGSRTSAANIDAGRPVHALVQCHTNVTQFLEQAATPIGGAKQPDVTQVGAGKLRQVLAIADQVVTHDDCRLESIEIYRGREFVDRHAMYSMRILETARLDIGRPVILDGHSPAQFERIADDRAGIEACSKDQDTGRRRQCGH